MLTNVGTRKYPHCQSRRLNNSKCEKQIAKAPSGGELKCIFLLLLPRRRNSNVLYKMLLN